ncbi:MAG: hypothetical protein COC24_004915 [Alphaproteobacteria bacterium]|nr:hypothetical protein [Alphaproteobacteria bacterium]
MAYITHTDELKTTSSITAKISKFLKNVGNSFIRAQEARAREHVKKYMTKSYKPF